MQLLIQIVRTESEMRRVYFEYTVRIALHTYRHWMLLLGLSLVTSPPGARKLALNTIV